MSFKFYMPTKVLINRDVVIENSKEFKGLGKKALIVTGKYSSKQNGSLDDVKVALEKEDIEYIVFDKVEENPSVETVCLASELGRAENVDFIVGIGGGSPIDAAKAIGVMIKNRELTRETLFTSKKLESIDIVAVPTTAGTGTETTQYSILTDHNDRTKKNLGQEIFPVLSLCDAKYMMGMNLDVSRNTAIDALSHIVEGYLNVNSNIIIDTLCEKALNIWGKAIPSLLNGDISLEDRENLLLASNVAGTIIAHTATSLPHGMGYNLTYFKNVPHGLANVCLYKEYLRVFKNKARVYNIYKFLGLSSYTEFEEIIEVLSKVDIEVTEEEIKEWASAFIANKAKVKNHPEDITEEEIYNIYKKSLIK